MSDDRIKHRFDAPRSDQRMTVRVAPGAGCKGTIYDSGEWFPPSSRLHRPKASTTDDASFDRIASRHTCRPTIKERSLTSLGVEHLVKGWEIANCDVDLAVILVADQRRIERNSTDKRLRSVDGIDDPTTFLARRSSLFFTKDVLSRVGLRDQFPNQSFRTLIGEGNRRLVRLGHDVCAGLEQRERRATSFIGSIDREGEAGRH